MQDPRPGSEVRSSTGRAPVSKTGGWGFDSLRACAGERWDSRAVGLALSSRGLGHSPLKAGTRVRIPLPLWLARRVRCGVRGSTAVLASRLRRGPAKLRTPIAWPHRLSVRTRPFQGRKTGSIPVGAMSAATLGAPTRWRGCRTREVQVWLLGRCTCTSNIWGCSSAWLECRSVTPEVAGSSPVSPVGRRGNRESGIGNRNPAHRPEMEIDSQFPISLFPISSALVVKLVDTPS